MQVEDVLADRFHSNKESVAVTAIQHPFRHSSRTPEGIPGLPMRSFLRPRSTIHTRAGLTARIVDRFLDWAHERGLELHRITPGLAGDYIGQVEGSPQTNNQALAALRHFFRCSRTAACGPAEFIRVRARHQAQRHGRQDARNR